MSARETEITSAELVAWAKRKADDTGDDRYLAVTEEFIRESKFKTTYYISEAARSALEQEQQTRNMAGKQEGSDFSSLVDAAILKAYGKKR